MYAVGRQTGRLQPMMVYFACGSVVRFCLVHKKIHVVNFFVNKIRVSSALLEAIAPSKRGIAGSMAAPAGSCFSLMSRRSWSKRPPRNSCYLTRLTRLFIKPGVSPDERQNRLRQHGTLVILFTKILHLMQNFGEQETISSALPEANRAGCPGRRLPGQ
jgi:hypothetical protein